MKAHSQLLFLLFFLCLGVPAHAEMMRWDRGGLHQYCNQVARDRQWKQIAEGWVKGDTTEIIKVSFTVTVNDCPDIASIRPVFVNEVNKAIVMIQNKQRRSTLRKIGRSFDYKDLCFVLNFRDKFGNRYPEPYLDSIMLVFGNISYYTRSKKDNWTESKELHEESFEEAFRIVQGESIACSNELSSYPDSTP